MNLQRYFDDVISSSMKTNGAFFCFGTDQFNEKKVDGVKYADMGAGMVCPVENVKALKKQMDDGLEAARLKAIKEQGAEAIIRHHFWNYETAYTMDETQARSQIATYSYLKPELFTEEIISKVFAECYQWDRENN